MCGCHITFLAPLGAHVVTSVCLFGTSLYKALNHHLSLIDQSGSVSVGSLTYFVVPTELKLLRLDLLNQHRILLQLKIN